jgi:hypothetical protein
VPKNGINSVFAIPKTLTYGQVFAVQRPMLSLTYTATSAALLMLLWKKGQILDHWSKQSLLRLAARAVLPGERELLWLQSLITGLRGGKSLEEILEGLRSQYDQAAKILAGAPSDKLCSKILTHCLKYGTPCLEVLQQLRQQQTVELRNQRRAKSLLAQAQLQAWIIALLPWFLLLALIWVDSDLGKVVLKSPLTWSAWALAAGLDFIAIKWLLRLGKRTLVPKIKAQILLELELLPMLRHLQAYISAGIDIEDAARESVVACAPSLKTIFFSLTIPEPKEDQSLPTEIFVVRRLLSQSILHGTPLRAELLIMAQEIESQRDARCEQALQTLPVKALLPLFSCAFPATLLILASFLSPLLSSL